MVFVRKQYTKRKVEFRNFARCVLSRVILLLYVCAVISDVGTWRTNTFECTYSRPVVRVDRRKRYLRRRHVTRKFLLGREEGTVAIIAFYYLSFLDSDEHKILLKKYQRIIITEICV